MIYLDETQLPTLWPAILTAVEAGRLGPSASIAPSGAPSGDTERVVCVYTRDFRDVADVTRVLEALVEMRVVRREGTVGVPYKIEAYERLGIWWDNEYGLRESIYGSREVLEGVVGDGWDPEDGVCY